LYTSRRFFLEISMTLVVVTIQTRSVKPNSIPQACKQQRQGWRAAMGGLLLAAGCLLAIESLQAPLLTHNWARQKKHGAAACWNREALQPGASLLLNIDGCTHYLATASGKP
jgi:hypothetical protein